MDPNTELILTKASRTANWEDEEKATNDLEALREEYRKRLYARPSEAQASASRNGFAQEDS